MVFQLLKSIVQLLEAYFSPISEDKIKEHFVLIYEILDEIIDYGIPQFTDYNNIKDYIFSGKKSSSLLSLDKLTESQAKQITSQVTGAISWRNPGIRHKSHNIWIDIIEEVNLLMANSGRIISAHVDGRVIIKCELSGMPECKIGINDQKIYQKMIHHVKNRNSDHDPRQLELNPEPSTKSMVTLDDFKFHQCVQLSQFNHNNTIIFIPPDGEFELMKYRITDNIKLPFLITPVEKIISNNLLEVEIQVKSGYAHDIMPDSAVKIKIPLPKLTCKVTTSIVNGRTSKVKWRKQENAVFWKIRKFQGQNNFRLNVKIEILNSTQQLVRARTYSEEHGHLNDADSQSSANSNPVNPNIQNWRNIGSQNFVKSAPNFKNFNRPPISIKFEVPFCPSGLKCSYLKVFENKLGYSCAETSKPRFHLGKLGGGNMEVPIGVNKWIRYIGRNGTYRAGLESWWSLFCREFQIFA